MAKEIIKSKPLFVYFHPGSYGTYIRWLVETMFLSKELIEPFTVIGTTKGNSHNYPFDLDLTKLCFDPDNIEQYLSDSLVSLFVHPKTKLNHNVSNFVKKYSQQGYKSIFVYPEKKYKLLAVNNWYYKSLHDWWDFQINLGTIDKNKLYQNWPVDKNIDVKNIPTWIKREFLSFYLMPAWEDQVEWYFPDKNKNIDFVGFDTIFYDTENFLQILESKLKLAPCRKFSKIKDIHKKMLLLQSSIGQDDLYTNIISALSDNYYLNWEPGSLTLVTEAIIQYHLRNIGIGLKCHDLNTFPTNTDDLKELFYEQ